MRTGEASEVLDQAQNGDATLSAEARRLEAVLERDRIRRAHEERRKGSALHDVA